MKNGNVKNSMRMFAGSLLICLLCGAGSVAVARGGGFHGGGGGFHGYGGGFHGYGWSGGFYHPHYWGGFYIGSEWFWGPTIVVAEVPYYYYGGIYYTPSGDGLVAVTPPATEPAVIVSTPSAPSEAAQAPAKGEPKAAQQPGETVTVNVPNAGGGYSPVKLVKVDKGYLGPQGEFYAGHPTIAELKVLYGN